MRIFHNRLFQILTAAISLVGIVAFALPETTHAQVGDIVRSIITGGVIDLSNIAYSVFARALYYISWAIGAVAGLFVALEAWIIGILLKLNTNIVNTTPVQIGFRVALSLANLGFVVGIIVVAIATILRNQTYGIKTTLFRIIVAAILVNFSLVICGAILNFADQFALFFLNSINPAGGNSFSNFAGSLAGAFNPQQMYSAPFDRTSSAQLDKLQGVMDGDNTKVSSFIQPIAALLFAFAGACIIVFILGALVVMLIVRYVTIGVLLILAPFAGMLWIFKAFSGNFQKWMNQFIRWALFPPVVIFFLYLTLKTAEQMSLTKIDQLALGEFMDPRATPVWGGLSAFFGAFIAMSIQPFLQIVIVGGLMFGGLVAANSLAITGADGALKMANNVKGAVTGAVSRGAKRRASRIASAPLRTKSGQWVSSKLQARLQTTDQDGRLKKLGKKAVNATATVFGARVAGRAMDQARIASTDNELEALKKQYAYAKDDKGAIKNLWATANDRERMVLSGMAHDKGFLHELGGVDEYMASGKTVDGKYVPSKTETLFERYGKSKEFGKLRTESGLSYIQSQRELRDMEASMSQLHSDWQQLTLQEKIERTSNSTNAQDQAYKKKFDQTQEDLKAVGDVSKLADLLFSVDTRKSFDELQRELKAEGKELKVPFKLDSQSLQAAQDSIAMFVATGMSGGRIGKTMNTLDDSGNSDLFRHRASGLGLSYDNLSTYARNYYNSTSSRTLGNDVESVFGVQRPAGTSQNQQNPTPAGQPAQPPANPPQPQGNPPRPPRPQPQPAGQPARPPGNPNAGPPGPNVVP